MTIKQLTLADVCTQYVVIVDSFPFRKIKLQNSSKDYTFFIELPLQYMNLYFDSTYVCNSQP